MAQFSTTVLLQTIEQLLAQGDPSLRAVASKLDISSRTLQRQLAKNESSYTELLDEVRYGKACEMLQQNTHKIKNIASLLGYADAGSFTRAFTRWSNISPQEYRHKTTK